MTKLKDSQGVWKVSEWKAELKDLIFQSMFCTITCVEFYEQRSFQNTQIYFPDLLSIIVFHLMVANVDEINVLYFVIYVCTVSHSLILGFHHSIMCILSSLEREGARWLVQENNWHVTNFALEPNQPHNSCPKTSERMSTR
jgi:hypothetical protein